MPIYEFRCASCGHRFEVMQRIADPAPACEECGGAVEKLISAPAFQFKGSGWYVTDYADKAKKGKEADGDGDGKAAKEKSDGAGDGGAQESAKQGKADGAKKESGGGDAKPSGAKSAGAE